MWTSSLCHRNDHQSLDRVSLDTEGWTGDLHLSKHALAAVFDFEANVPKTEIVGVLMSSSMCFCTPEPSFLSPFNQFFH